MQKLHPSLGCCWVAQAWHIEGSRNKRQKASSEGLGQSAGDGVIAMFADTGTSHGSTCRGHRPRLSSRCQAQGAVHGFRGKRRGSERVHKRPRGSTLGGAGTEAAIYLPHPRTRRKVEGTSWFCHTCLHERCISRSGGVFSRFGSSTTL